MHYNERVVLLYLIVLLVLDGEYKISLFYSVQVTFHPVDKVICQNCRTIMISVIGNLKTLAFPLRSR